MMIQVIFLLNLSVSNTHVVKEVIPGTFASDLGMFSSCSFSVTVSWGVTVGAVHNIEHHVMISQKYPPKNFKHNPFLDLNTIPYQGKTQPKSPHRRVQYRQPPLPPSQHLVLFSLQRCNMKLCYLLRHCWITFPFAVFVYHTIGRFISHSQTLLFLRDELPYEKRQSVKKHSIQKNEK